MTDGLSNDKMQLKALWCEAFGDRPEDVDAFLNRFEDGMKSLQRIRK